MKKSNILKILDVYEIALQDEEYLRLYAEYVPVEKKLQKLLAVLPQSQRQDLEDYLLASVELHHRLMALAIQHNI